MIGFFSLNHLRMMIAIGEMGVAIFSFAVDGSIEGEEYEEEEDEVEVAKNSATATNSARE